MLLDIENLPIFPFSRERKGKTGESERREPFIAQCLLLFFGPSIASCEPHESDHLGSFSGESARFFRSSLSISSRAFIHSTGIGVGERELRRAFVGSKAFRQFANTRGNVCNHRNAYFQLRNLIFTIHCATPTERIQ